MTRKIEEPENRDAFFYAMFLLIYVNNSIQIQLILPNLIKPNLKLTKMKVNFELPKGIFLRQDFPIPRISGTPP